MSLLACDRVTCLRGHRILFEKLSFTLGPGDAGLVTGPNGVGKSSLLRIAAGLLRPVAGQVKREGEIAYAAEAAALDARSSLADALAFWSRIDGGKAGDVLRGLEAMGIAGLAEVPVRMLSTGQRKRAALARLIGGPADIWLLDEPGNGLDIAALDALAVAMKAHRSKGGVILAATHQPLGLADTMTITL
jgi:heme exporter protein A